MDARDARRLAHLGLLEFVAEHVEVGSGQVTKDELWDRYLAATPPELRTTRAALLRYIWSHYREHLRGGQFHYQPILKGIRLLYSIHPPLPGSVLPCDICHWLAQRQRIQNDPVASQSQVHVRTDPLVTWHLFWLVVGDSGQRPGFGLPQLDLPARLAPGTKPSQAGWGGRGLGFPHEPAGLGGQTRGKIGRAHV